MPLVLDQFVQWLADSGLITQGEIDAVLGTDDRACCADLWKPARLALARGIAIRQERAVSAET